jgi:hypothetical protein
MLVCELIFKHSDFIGIMRKKSTENIEWVVPEKIHTPPTEEIFAVRRGREEKCLRMSEGGGGGKMS